MPCKPLHALVPHDETKALWEGVLQDDANAWDKCYGQGTSLTWIGLTDFETPVLRKPADVPGELQRPLGAAAILVEGTTPPASALPLLLARVPLKTVAPQELRITLGPDGRLLVETSGKTHKINGRIETDLSGQGLAFRILLNWPGEMVVENIETGRTFLGRIDALDPAAEAGLRTFIVQAPPSPARAHLSCYAASVSAQPVGPQACIAEGTPIDTPEGLKPIENISPGDWVITHDHGPQPVIWAGWREMPSCSFHRPVALRAPYFGLENDVIVSSCQRILIGGPAVDYLFGVEDVLVRAGDLVDGPGAMSLHTQRVVRYFHLLFDQPQLISMAGTLGESLNLAQYDGLDRFLGQSMLRDLNGAIIPCHTQSTRPLKEGVEAAALMSTRI